MSEEEVQPNSKPADPNQRVSPCNYDKRYTVSLAKPKEPNCFLDFFETDDFGKAKDKCIDTACDEEREAIVWDRDAAPNGIVFRHKPEGLEPEVKEDVKPSGRPRRGRKSR